MVDDNNSGFRIKAWREHFGFSELDVAKKFGWRLSYFRAIEKGKVEVHSETFGEIAEMFGISSYQLGWFLPGEEMPVYKSRTVQPRELPDHQKLRSLFDYCPTSGAFIYLNAARELFKSDRSYQSHNRKIGQRADIKGASPYRTICVDGKVWGAHRMAVLYTDGPFDKSLEIDHLNGEKDDNRRENLRLVTSALNARNVRKYRDTNTGIVGVKRGEGRQTYYTATCQADGLVYSIRGLLSSGQAEEKLRELKEKLNLGFGPSHGQ